jgi:hypothetical protein
MKDNRVAGKKKKHYTPGQWILTIVGILFISLLLNILPLFTLLAGGLFGINYFLVVKPERQKEKKPGGGGDIVRGVFLGIFMVAGFMAPSRAILLGFFRITGWEEAESLFLGNALDGLLDAWLGICGVILGIAIGSKLWNRGLKIRTQLENLPTSTVHGAAVGLAEFKGVARPLKDKRQRQTQAGGIETSTDAGFHEKPILFERIDPGSKGETTIDTKYSPFFLEDESGRILVDPQGAEFWDGSGNFLWSPIRSIYLEKRFTVDAQNIHTRMLLPDDPVYLIGTVEENPDASKDARDEDRLVVRPSRSLVQSGFLQRLLFGEGERTKGSDIHHVFFLTDLAEFKAAEVLTRGMKHLWIWMLIWVVLSLVLTLMYGEHLGTIGPAWKQILGFTRR